MGPIRSSCIAARTGFRDRWPLVGGRRTERLFRFLAAEYARMWCGSANPFKWTPSILSVCCNAWGLTPGGIVPPPVTHEQPFQTPESTRKCFDRLRPLL